MATIEVRGNVGSMSVGRVYQRAFATLIHNPGPTLGLAFLLGALPGLLISWLFQSTIRSGFQGASSQFILGASAVMLLTYLAMLVLSAIVQGALTRATVAESRGRKASFSECLTAALPVVVPLVGLVILWALGIMVGAIFLFVPAIILACMWAVAVPAMVEERVGIRAAFGRSRKLTRGNRWKVFGVLLILAVAYYLLFAVFGLVLRASMTGFDGRIPTMTAGFVIMSTVTGTLFNALWGTLAPSMYIDLREATESGSIADLEEVFA